MGLGLTKPLNTTEESKTCAKKKKICCVCLDTKKLRDECIVNLGEEQCKKYINDHNQCLRNEGFDIK
ncbi:hypothetical protein YYC_03696 [Plasmodium yoelii 17X]|uniref:Copper chaperone COX17-1 n=3 Tax=Plasmodium yoelii TaxID=5861 RepID=Q7RI08_PLAYO|nr:cytochrome c oxidase copper chaperone, putative [Plasmodium yoelii]EAA15594.1 copper chaperone COX17-1 [Plasmodium yoelii yoelii]ETB58947.1 hypothetical protein YYC_03696 [Plasmodium yoelii 17X]CDU16697.1 cytochrome c oxidase copper chaperone, putative [Plasmodium yoelii]VTZ74220.1 cytochrome c oxidase copper chaperone, putative [Plasmodium yoelii]|eukprot:XP_724029.1 cytochrome c oxidase copper chaperone, putative [Plasmodium yoelii]